MATPSVGAVEIFDNAPPTERPLNSWELREQSQPGASTAVQHVPVSAAFAGTDFIEQGKAALAEATREKASVLDSMKAAAGNWIPADLYRAYAAPKFEAKEWVGAQSRLGQLPFVVTADQREWLLEHTNSDESFDYHADEMQAALKRSSVAADHSVIAGATLMADPGMWALMAASGGIGGAVARTGFMGARTAAAVVGGAGSLVQSEIIGEVRPVTVHEKILGVLMNAAGGAMSVRGGKLVAADPDFPGKALTKTVQDMHTEVLGKAEAGALRAEEAAVLKRIDPAPTPKVTQAIPEVPAAKVAGAEAKGVPVRQARTERFNEPVFPYDAYSAKGLLADMVKNPDPLVAIPARRMRELLGHDIQVRAVAKKDLLKGRAHYDPQTHAVYITKDTPQNIQLHEITHAMTVHKLVYGLEQRASAHGRIASEIESIWKSTAEAYKGTDKNVLYHLQDIKEFVAGAFSGKSAFTDLLANTAVKGGTSVLGKFVDSVRKILGIKKSDTNALVQTMGLTEKLVGEKLRVTLMRDAAKIGDDATALKPGSMSIQFAPAELEGLATLNDAKVAVSQKLARNMEWSLHKTMTSFGKVASEIADIFVDNARNLAGNSVENISRAVRADLTRKQIVFEEALYKHMAEQGYGTRKQIFDSRKALEVQAGIEKEVYKEMTRRHSLIADGKVVDNAGVPPHVVAIADALGETGKLSLSEMKGAGVLHSEQIAENAGFVTRRWDVAKVEAAEQAFMDAGLTQAEARLRVRDWISVGMQRRNGFDPELAGDITKAIIDRTRSRGYFEDTAFRGTGADGIEEIRSLLTGLPEGRIQRVLDRLAGKVDEAGKPSMLKHRVDIALDEALTLPNGKEMTIIDLLDTGLVTLTEKYLDGVAAQVALAKKGLMKPTDITALRTKLSHSIDDLAERKKAVTLFDNMIAHIKGEPVGEDMNSFMRSGQAVNQMVSLAYSGMWQVTEYSTMMAHHGALKTLKYAVQELPVIRQMFDAAGADAHSLRNVLASNSSQDIRLRPFISKMEDNFNIAPSSIVQHALQQAKQLVPYINGMKYIQKHQARVAANLMVDSFTKAVRGDVKAIAVMEKYGLESHVLRNISADVSAHGMDTAKWSKATWDAVRAPMTKMMDESVLRARSGEIPAFAQHSTLGKFIFTYRNFVLAAHNKVLAGGLERDGFAGVSLLLLYQMPLAMLMTSSANAISGKKALTDDELVKKSFGQMGALGLFSEVWNWASGNKDGIGAPGLIVADRAIGVLGSLKDMDAGKTGAAVIGATPLVAILPGSKAIQNNLKTKEK